MLYFRFAGRRDQKKHVSQQVTPHDPMKRITLKPNTDQLEQSASKFFKLKSLGVSETSQTLDTRNKKQENESTSSLMDKLSPWERKKLFNFRFKKEISVSSVNDVHLENLRKTVNSLHDKSERYLNSRDRLQRAQVRPEPENLLNVNQNRRIERKYRKVCSLNCSNKDLKLQEMSK